MRVALAAAVAFVAAAPAAAFGPGDPPNLCAASYFADVIGTPKADDLTGTGRAERIYGLGGNDQLNGSDTRVSCLVGGPGDDLLQIHDGGGFAFGEAGQDTLVGSPVDDQLYGGAGRDTYAAGAGDDKLDARDGVAEVVDCGDGNDLVTADRRDLLIGCETVLVDGPSNPTATVRAAGGTTFRASLRAPFSAGAGAYKVVLTTTALGRDCASGPMVIGRTGGRVTAGHTLTIRMRAPKRAGFCPGISHAGIVYYRGHDPGRPVARMQFRTRR